MFACVDHSSEQKATQIDHSSIIIDFNEPEYAADVSHDHVDMMAGLAQGFACAVCALRTI